MTFHPFEGNWGSLWVKTNSVTHYFTRNTHPFSNFSKLCSPFRPVLMSVPTLFGLQANVKQGGWVGKRGGVWMFLLESEKSTERQVSKTADWLRNFYKDACAQRWPLTYCGDWKRSEKSSENIKKCEIERAIEWYFELLLIFAWPVRQNLCSFINGNMRRKIGLLKNSMKLMDCSCLPTTTTMFGFCFGLVH